MAVTLLQVCTVIYIVERERERERERRERERECVCVCVCERERERERYIDRQTDTDRHTLGLRRRWDNYRCHTLETH
jgi:hypothetical protein